MAFKWIFTSSRFRNSSGYVFFFNWSSDFGHAETGNGAEKLVVLRREFFSL